MPATIGNAYVVVTGLQQIQRDLERSIPASARVLRDGLKQAAEPTARIAEQLSLSKIPRMPRSPQWAVTRIGATRHGVYIVPKQRGVKSRNPYDPRRRGLNIKGGGLVTLMMERSFEPAAELGANAAEAEVTALLDQVMR